MLMTRANKVNTKTQLAWFYMPLLLILTYSINIFAAPVKNFQIPLQEKKDSVSANLRATGKNFLVNDSPKTKITIDSFPVKFSKDTLAAPVVYHADDSMVLDVPAKKMYLYGKKSNVKYQDNDLAAPKIEYDNGTSLVKAVLVKDSLGKVIAYPEFAQGDFKTKSDTIVFNMKTRRGITKGSYTQQGEIYVHGEVIKKVDAQTFYALNGQFTTCNLDTPHFAFVSRKIKFINQKMAYTGPVHPEFEGVPLPTILPFGIFPLKQGRRSGLLAPSFNVNQQFGISLDNLGYYKVLSDNWDVVTQGTLYSYGSWKLNVNPRYYKRYRYSGNLTFSMQRMRPLDEPANKSFNVVWSHSSDNKARPGVSFRASVNAGSSSYNRYVANNPYRNINNQMYSTISYSKVWKDKPFNISINASHNQNTGTKFVQLNLPDVAFNVNTLYPFRRKEPTGDYKWYENLGIGLNTLAQGSTSFYDTANSVTKKMLENYRYGIKHSMPITLSLPPLGPLQVSPGITYNETWHQQKLLLGWNSVSKKLDTLSLKKGIFTSREMSFSLGVSTRIFGLFGFSKSSRIQGIRHQITPRISASYTPELNKRFNYNVQVDTTGRISPKSELEGNVFGGSRTGRFGGLSFGIDNNLAMKIRSKHDTTEAGIKKVSILDQFSINSGYNFLLDSFKFSNITMNASTNLFQKVSISAYANLSPYLRGGTDGRMIDKLVWTKTPFTLGKMTSANISLSTSFNGGKKQAKGNAAKNLGDVATYRDQNGLPLNEWETEAAYIQNNPGEFVDFNIPWDMSVSYSFMYSNSVYGLNPSKSISQSANFNGSINLTPKWKLGGSTSYNITQKEIGLVTMYLSRDLHCWQMSINISPVGQWRFFSVNISPKSSILRDLKINRTRTYYNTP